MFDTLAIRHLLQQRAQEVTLVCIDGPAGAGKTTLADELLEHFPEAQIIHMDDLYNGWDDALDAGLTERLLTSIREPLRNGEPIRYQRYDWYADDFADFVELGVARFLILEGVGAAQAAMRDIATLSIFIDIDPAEGRARVIERDGTVSAEHIDAWQSQEQAHFAADGTRDAVQLLL